MVNSEKHDISYQLGAYFDMRYREYFTRFKFILGLSKYNEDDTVSVREEEVIIQPFKKYDQMDKANYWNYWEMEEQKDRNKETDSSHTTTSSPILDLLEEMATHITQEDPFDKVVDELVLSMYPDLDEQEFQVLKTVVWVMWDLSSGCNFAYYNAVVSYLIGSQYENRRDLFATIKDVEDTIMRLVHEGIISQYIDFSGNVDKDGNTTWRYDDPFISLSFTKDSDACEMILAISEVFSHEIRAFIGPHTNYDVKSKSLE